MHWSLKLGAVLASVVVAAGMLVGLGVDATISEFRTAPACGVTEPLSAPGELFLMIAGRNLFVYGLLIAGVFTAGILTGGVLFLNGILIGLLFAGVIGAGCIGVGLIVTLPHAVLEVPAFLAGGAVGLRTAALFIGPKLNLGSNESSGTTGTTDARLLTLIGLVLLLVAAGVEATVSRELLARVGG